MSISTLTNQNTLTAVSQSATIASGATSTLVFNYPAAVGTFPVSFTGTSSNGTTTPNMIDIAADTLTAYSINTLPCDSAGGTSKSITMTINNNGHPTSCIYNVIVYFNFISHY